MINKTKKSETIKNIKKKIDQRLTSFMSKVKREYSFHYAHPILYESIREFVLRDGKRIRPLLFILSYKGYSSGNKKTSSSIYDAAICLELLHDSLLIHDDIIDRASLRRGKPTMHKLLEKITRSKKHDNLGADLSIIAGDIVFALTIDSFLLIEGNSKYKEKALKYFIKTAAFTAMGEFIDTMYGVESIEKIKEKDILKNYTLKTSKYTFDCPLAMGAILSGVKESEIKKLSNLGTLLGQAFQMQDDIIGIFDSEKNIGKSILSDISEFKKTLLVCHAFRKLRNKGKNNFVKLFYKPKKTFKDLIEIRKIFIKTKSLDYSLGEIKKRFNKTTKIISSLKMKPTYKKIVKDSIIEMFKPCKKIENQIKK